jgi:glycosyltransferase involved in cell wall biosynthesis
MFKHATDYFACSEAAAKYAFPEHIVNAGKVKIIPNAIDIQRFRFDEKKRQEMRSKLGVDDKLVIGCVGRFRTEKNQGFLLGVLKDALKIAPSSVLLFVGDGPLEDAVKQKAEEMGFANKCIFMGMQPNVPEIMQAIDVLAMPSMFEGLPLTGIEAQANGLSIVASTGIPREMNVLGLVDFLDLSMSTEKWAEVLVKKALEPKKDTYDDIKKAGYDIHTTAEWLQDFYLKHG